MYFDRTGGAKTARNSQISRTKEWPGPHLGWVKGTNARNAPMGSSVVLQNVFPTKQGGRLRKGSVTRATTPVTSLLPFLSAYESGTIQKLFAATETDIFDVTAPADPLVSPAPVVSGLTSSDWSTTQITDGNGDHYMFMANGIDGIRRYNGTAWLLEAGSPAITNSAGISHVWMFKKRVWAIRKDTMKACYLATNAIGGAFTDFPLTRVFSKGGSLLFGATWSLNAGNGLTDVCLFVTTKGEVAVYEGIDPASDMTLQGVYQIGAPLGKNSWFRSGGDLVVMTADGIAPISAAVDLDRAAIKGKRSITLPIEPEWQKIIRLRGAAEEFPVALWQNKGMLVIGLPQRSGEDIDCLVVNAVDGTWARFTGWDVRALCVFQDRLFFATSDGVIKEADVTGSDDGSPYHCIWMPSFDSLGSPAEKAAVHARMIARTNYPFTIQMFACADYKIEIPVPLPSDLPPNASLWDVALWDDIAVWTGSDEAVDAVLEWQTVSAVGLALAPGMSINIGQDDEPEFEIIGIDLQYEAGKVIMG